MTHTQLRRRLTSFVLPIPPGLVRIHIILSPFPNILPTVAAAASYVHTMNPRKDDDGDVSWHNLQDMTLGIFEHHLFDGTEIVCHDLSAQQKMMLCGQVVSVSPTATEVLKAGEKLPERRLAYIAAFDGQRNEHLIVFERGGKLWEDLSHRHVFVRSDLPNVMHISSAKGAGADTNTNVLLKHYRDDRVDGDLLVSQRVEVVWMSDNSDGSDKERRAGKITDFDPSTGKHLVHCKLWPG